MRHRKLARTISNCLIPRFSHVLVEGRRGCRGPTGQLLHGRITLKYFDLWSNGCLVLPSCIDVVLAQIGSRSIHVQLIVDLAIAGQIFLVLVLGESMRLLNVVRILADLSVHVEDMHLRGRLESRRLRRVHLHLA